MRPSLVRTATGSPIFGSAVCIFIATRWWSAVEVQNSTWSGQRPRILVAVAAGGRRAARGGGAAGRAGENSEAAGSIGTGACRSRWVAELEAALAAGGCGRPWQSIEVEIVVSNRTTDLTMQMDLPEYLGVH